MKLMYGKFTEIFQKYTKNFVFEIVLNSSLLFYCSSFNDYITCKWQFDEIILLGIVFYNSILYKCESH